MKKIIGILSIAAMFAATGCLKDDNFDDGRYGIEQNGIKGLSFGPTTSAAITGIPGPLLDSASAFVVYNGPSSAEQDIPFTVAADNSIITDPAITPLPAANYSLNPNGVIRAGTNGSPVQVTILKSDELDPNKTYGLGLRITKAPTGIVIASNIGTAVLRISIKNRIDGVYRYQTSGSTSLQPNKDVTIELVTNGPTTVDLVPGLLATYSNAVSYTVDKVTNQVTVTCPSLGVQTPQDVRSKFDPVTHNMVVFWKQGNGGRTFEETFTYLRPRS